VSGAAGQGGMLESILTLLVEEVRELKKSNLDLHKEVVLLREKQEQTDEKVDRITQTARASLSRSLLSVVHVPHVSC
jgi:uncharacterized protein (UPF0305 family)